MKEGCTLNTTNRNSLRDFFSDRGIEVILNKLLGYAQGNTDYKEAKHAVNKGWTKPRKSLSKEEISSHLARNGWIGLVIPDRNILVDVDQKPVYEHLLVRFLHQGVKCIAITTPKGGQFFFRDNGKVQSQGVKKVTVGGVVVDYRLSGRGYIVLPTENTPGRYVEHMDSDLDEMPVFFLPSRQYNQEHDEDIILSCPIAEGCRDDTIFRHASRLREWNVKYRLGLSEDNIEQIIQQVNCFLCEPPLDEKTVRDKVKSALSYPVSSTSITVEGQATDPPSDKTPEVKPPPFPDVIGGLAAEFGKVYSDVLESPKSFFEMAFLTCLGTVLSGRATLNIELRPQPRLFTNIIGESADERKSTAIAKTTDFFSAVLSSFSLCHGVGSAEGLQKVMEKEGKETGRTNVLLCFDEFKQFVSKAGIEGSVLLPCVNTLFESNRYENHTAKNEVCLVNAHLSLLAASTVDTYERTWNAQFTDIGFNNRLWLVPGKGIRKYSLPVKIAEQDIKRLGKDLAEILQKIGTGLELDFTEKANGLYHEWYMGREQSTHSKEARHIRSEVDDTTCH